MSDDKRNCIFTNLPATAKLTLSSSRHNWTKSVPCTKEFLESKKNNKLNDVEFKLVELFFLKETALLRVDYLENKMTEIRKMLNLNDHIKISLQDIEIIEINLEKAEELTHVEESAKIILNDKNLWE
jgi:hypothetical protein